MCVCVRERERERECVCVCVAVFQKTRKCLQCVAPSVSVPPSLSSSLLQQGFISAYDSVKARIFALVDDIMASDSSGPWTIYVTGHSLGGALSTLAAYELAVRRCYTRSPSPLSGEISLLYVLGDAPHNRLIYIPGEPN